MKRMVLRLSILAVFALAVVAARAQTICAGQVAQIISPTPGSTFPTGAVTFKWCQASGDYFLDIASVPGAHDIFFAYLVRAESVTLGPACAPIIPFGCIPPNVETIYVTLWTNVAQSGPRSYVAAPTLTFTVGNSSPNQCGYAISTSGLGAPASGGSIGLTIHTDAGCPWSIENPPAWLTVSDSTQGTGSSTVTLVAGVNFGGARSASLSVGGVSVPVRQLDGAACGGSSSCAVRVLPHLAFGGQWITGLSAISSGTTAGNFSVSFYGDAGTSLALPFTGGLGSLSTLTDTVPPEGVRYYEAENPSVGDQSGWALVTADDSVAAQATFRRHTTDGHFYEAAVPSSEGYSRFVMPFDVTTFAPTGAQLFTAFAVANLDPSASAHFVCTARNQSGVLIPNAVSIPALGPLGHYAAFNFPLLTGQGTLDCSADTLVSAIGLRSIGGDALSTLPVIVK